MGLIKLSELLEKGMPGITSQKVKLVRHKDGRGEILVNGKMEVGDPYSWYVDNPQVFLDYQSEQSKDIFKDVDYIVSFIGEEGTTARMIGVFRVDGYDEERKAKYNSDYFYYKLTEVEEFKKEFSERVIIEWGNNAVTWHQWLKQGDEDKDVIAIEKIGVEWKYPSYEEVVLSFEKLKKIIKGDGGIWKHKLTAVKGIYVISDLSTGRLYVGSAYQEGNGIWGRWKRYVETNGTCDNKLLKELVDKDPDYARKNFQWGILQTCPLRITDREIVHLEQTWKKKFGEKACALNAN